MNENNYDYKGKLTQEELNKIIEDVRSGRGEDVDANKRILFDKSITADMREKIRTVITDDKNIGKLRYFQKELNIEGLTPEQIRTVSYMIWARQAEIEFADKENEFTLKASFYTENDALETENEQNKDKKNKKKPEKENKKNLKPKQKQKKEKKPETAMIDFKDADEVLDKIVEAKAEDLSKLKTNAAKHMPKNEKRKKKWLNELNGLVTAYNEAEGEKSKKKAFKKIKNKTKGGNWFIRWTKGIGMGVYNLVKAIVWPLIKPVVRSFNKTIVKPLQERALKSQEKEASKLKYQKVLELTAEEEKKCKKANEKANKKHKKMGLPELECREVEPANLKEENIKEMVELFGKDRFLESINNKEEIDEKQRALYACTAKILADRKNREKYINEMDKHLDEIGPKTKLVNAIAEVLNVESDMDAITKKVEEISEQIKSEKKNKKSKNVDQSGAEKPVEITPENSLTQRNDASISVEDLKKEVNGESENSRTLNKKQTKTGPFTKPDVLNENGDEPSMNP